MGTSGIAVIVNDWPTTLDIAPLREWPAPLRGQDDRRQSAFAAPLSTTLQQLERELRAVGALEQELLIAIPPEQFRRDGQPRADARALHPGVVLQFRTDLGRLAYPCDSFTSWQDNLRAITLSLEALRKVDRYGVTAHGEQYRGFLALEAPAAEPSAFATAEDAERWLRRMYQTGEPLNLRQLVRKAKRLAHPDAGGTTDIFLRVVAAERTLLDSGRLW